MVRARVARRVHQLHREIDALGRRVGAFGVRMSFSRRIGALPSISKRVRWSWLVMTHSPIRMRSLGLSSTFSAMPLSAGSYRC